MAELNKTQSWDWIGFRGGDRPVGSRTMSFSLSGSGKLVKDGPILQSTKKSVLFINWLRLYVFTGMEACLLKNDGE